MRLFDEMLKMAEKQREEALDMLKDPNIEKDGAVKRFVGDALQEIEQMTGTLKDMQNTFKHVDTKMTWQKLKPEKGTEAWVMNLSPDAQFYVALERLQKNSYRVLIKEIVHYRAEKRLVEKNFRKRTEAEDYIKQYMENVLVEHKDIVDGHELFAGVGDLLKIIGSLPKSSI